MDQVGLIRHNTFSVKGAVGANVVYGIARSRPGGSNTNE